MGHVTISSNQFSSQLPFYAPPPVIASPVGRWSPKDLKLGALLKWAPDIVNGAPTPAATVPQFAAPQIALDPDNVLGARFGPNSQLTYPQIPPLVATCYLVFSIATFGTHAHTIMDFGSPTLLCSSAGALRIDGTVGDNIHPSTVVAGQRYAVAWTYDLDANNTTIDMIGLTNPLGGFTDPAGTRYKFGAATASYFDGWIYEVSIHNGVHGAMTRELELDRLRTWYDAA